MSGVSKERAHRPCQVADVAASRRHGGASKSPLGGEAGNRGPAGPRRPASPTEHYLRLSVGEANAEEGRSSGLSVVG